MEDQKLVRSIIANIENVVFGKTLVIYDILKCLIAGGHVLIEDVPGVGKTTIVKALAKSLNLSYSRIQFTPDLLPSDITGISIYDRKTCEFLFKKGPVFANIILADEINRTSPKTQSALLEVMEEAQITEGNNTYILSKPFIVLATQNPIEHEGTYILPEAQLDRFMMKIKIGYANKESESKILQIYSSTEPIQQIEPSASGEQVISLQNKARQIFVSKEITDYIVSLVNATRNNKYITLGASTRAALSLLKIAKATSFIEGREYVTPQDVKSNGIAVLSHRVSLASSAKAGGYTCENIIDEILDKVPIPLVTRHG